MKMGDEQKLRDFVTLNEDLLSASDKILGHQFTDWDIPNEDGSDWDRPNISEIKEGIPELGLENIKLHRYQLAAIQWMQMRHERGISCIIADEMGK